MLYGLQFQGLGVPLLTVCHHSNMSECIVASYVLQINSNFCSYGSELSNQVGYKSVVAQSPWIYGFMVDNHTLALRLGVVIGHKSLATVL